MLLSVFNFAKYFEGKRLSHKTYIHMYNGPHQASTSFYAPEASSLIHMSCTYLSHTHAHMEPFQKLSVHLSFSSKWPPFRSSRMVVRRNTTWATRTHALIGILRMDVRTDF